MLQEQPRIFAFGRDERVPSNGDLHEQFLELYDHPQIILDLRSIDLLGVAFLTELGQLRLHRRNLGLPLGRLIVDSQYVRNALSAVGFERNWAIYRTPEEALASFDAPDLRA